MDALISALQKAASTLPRTLLHSIANAVEAHPLASDRARRDAVRSVVPTTARENALSICDAWQMACPTLPGAAVALALRSVAATATALRDAQTVELVWTGPVTSVPTRSTRQALVDLTREAKHTLLLVSFSAYRDQGIIDELNTAADRHVEIILILETESDSRGRLSHDAAKAFDELHERVSFYVWPASGRPFNGGSLHAKTIIADRRAALVSSANLSGAAMERNMELGVLISGEPVPGLIEQHFRLLIAQRVLVPVTK